MEYAKSTTMGLFHKKPVRPGTDRKSILFSQLALAVCIILFAANLVFFVFFPKLIAPLSVVLSNAVTLLLAVLAFRPATVLLRDAGMKQAVELRSQMEQEAALQERLQALERENRALEARLDTREQTNSAGGELQYTFKLEQMEFAKKGYMVREEDLDALEKDENLRELIPDVSLWDRMLSAVSLKRDSIRKILYLRKYYYKVSVGIDFSRIKYAFDQDGILFSGVQYSPLHDISSELSPDERDVAHCWILETDARDKDRTVILNSAEYEQLCKAYERMQEQVTRQSLDEESGQLCQQYTSVLRRNISARFPRVSFVDSIEDSDKTWYALREGTSDRMVREVTANMFQLSNVIEGLSTLTPDA